MNLNHALDMPYIEKVIIHSIEANLYQVSILAGGEEHYLTDKRGVILRSHNKLSLQALFQNTKVTKMVLSHISPYDEMIGLSSTNNRLEVPLGTSQS